MPEGRRVRDIACTPMPLMGTREALPTAPAAPDTHGTTPKWRRNRNGQLPRDRCETASGGSDSVPGSVAEHAPVNGASHPTAALRQNAMASGSGGGGSPASLPTLPSDAWQPQRRSSNEEEDIDAYLDWETKAETGEVFHGAWHWQRASGSSSHLHQETHARVEDDRSHSVDRFALRLEQHLWLPRRVPGYFATRNELEDVGTHDRSLPFPSRAFVKSSPRVDNVHTPVLSIQNASHHSASISSDSAHDRKRSTTTAMSLSTRSLSRGGAVTRHPSSVRCDGSLSRHPSSPPLLLPFTRPPRSPSFANSVTSACACHATVDDQAEPEEEGYVATPCSQCTSPSSSSSPSLSQHDCLRRDGAGEAKRQALTKLGLQDDLSTVDFLCWDGTFDEDEQLEVGFEAVEEEKRHGRRASAPHALNPSRVCAASSPPAATATAATPVASRGTAATPGNRPAVVSKEPSPQRVGTHPKAEGGHGVSPRNAAAGGIFTTRRFRFASPPAGIAPVVMDSPTTAADTPAAATATAAAWGGCERPHASAAAAEGTVHQPHLNSLHGVAGNHGIGDEASHEASVCSLLTCADVDSTPLTPLAISSNAPPHPPSMLPAVPIFCSALPAAHTATTSSTPATEKANSVAAHPHHHHHHFADADLRSPSSSLAASAVTLATPPNAGQNLVRLPGFAFSALPQSSRHSSSGAAAFGRFRTGRSSNPVSARQRFASSTPLSPAATAATAAGAATATVAHPVMTNAVAAEEGQVDKESRVSVMPLRSLEDGGPSASEETSPVAAAALSRHGGPDGGGGEEGRTSPALSFSSGKLCCVSGAEGAAAADGVRTSDAKEEAFNATPPPATRALTDSGSTITQTTHLPNGAVNDGTPPPATCEDNFNNSINSFTTAATAAVSSAGGGAFTIDANRLFAVGLEPIQSLKSTDITTSACVGVGAGATEHEGAEETDEEVPGRSKQKSSSHPIASAALSIPSPASASPPPPPPPPSLLDDPYNQTNFCMRALPEWMRRLPRGKLMRGPGYAMTAWATLLMKKKQQQQQRRGQPRLPSFRAPQQGIALPASPPVSVDGKGVALVYTADNPPPPLVHGAPGLHRLTPSQVRARTAFNKGMAARRHHNDHSSKDAAAAAGASSPTTRECVMVIRKVVYDVSAFLAYHPGGERIMLDCEGKDATAVFDAFHSWINCETMLGPFAVAILDTKEL